jgi:HSP20 family protein
MNSLSRRNGGFPSIFSDWFDKPSLLAPDFFDFDASFAPTRLGMNVPSVNVEETSKEFVLEMAAPGMTRKDFKVEVDNGTLCISSEKEEEKKEKEKDYTRHEFSYSSFSRTFSLPDNVKDNSIEAKYDNGILRVTIPKKEVTPVKAAKEIAVA